MLLVLTSCDHSLSEKTDDKVYLGRWSLPKLTSEDENDRILPYVFEDREKLFQAYRYVWSVYEHLLAELTPILNEIHAVKYSSRFWGIFVGYWLKDYLEVMYERYASIQHAKRINPAFKVQLVPPRDYQTPRNSIEFTDLYNQDRYNHQLYSQIIEHLGFFEKSYLSKTPRPPARAKKSRSARVKDIVRWASVLAARWNRVYITSSYLPTPTLLKLTTKLRSIPALDTPRFLHDSISPIDHQTREKLAQFKARDEFEEIIRATLKVNFPQIFIEQFQKLNRLTELFFPKRPSLIMTSQGIFVNEGFKLWAAKQTETRGVPLVILQHGGTYGSARWYSSEDYETSIADYYLSYGWSDPNRPNVTPFFANKLPNARKYQDGAILSREILWVLATFPKYAYSMYATPSGPHFFDFLKQQATFLGALTPETRQHLRCRAYPIDFGWGDLPFLREQAGAFELDRSGKPIVKRLQEIGILVCTYNATVLIEGLAANVPTISFWNPAHWELRESAVPYFEELIKVKILHYSPESAAQHLNQVAQDPLSWWTLPEVQEVRHRYCHVFARTSESSAKAWEQWIREHELLTSAQ